MFTRHIGKGLAACLALLLPLACAWAQPARDGRSITQVATDQSPDRGTRLLEGARREAQLTVYYAHPIVKDIAEAYSKKFGIKVRLWRAGSEAIMQRVFAEARANRHEVDVFLSTAADTEAASRERLLQEVRSPVQADLIPGALPEHRQWAAFNLDVFTASYNTRLVRKEDLPKTYQDLTDPKWKGKLAVEANDHIWWGALSAEMGEAQARKLFDAIVGTNGISVRKGHSVLAGMVASGEVPLALTVYSWNPEQLKRKGAPVEGLYLQPLFAFPAAVAVMARAPNPNAAVLFYDFVLGEGQRIMADADYGPTSRKVDSHLSRLPGFKIIDAVQTLEQQDRWLKMYDEIFIKRAK